MNKTVKVLCWATFAFYCFMVFRMLFLDMRSYFPQNGITVYFQQSNFVPFRSIYAFGRAFWYGWMDRGVVARNLLGNLILFFPMGCYLPCLFFKMRKLWRFCLVILGMLLTVELLQPIFCIGFFDVDDILLNFLGGLGGFGTVHIPVLNRMLRKSQIYFDK